MVILIIKIPLDTMALTTVDRIEPNATVQRVEVRGIREAAGCDFQVL